MSESVANITVQVKTIGLEQFQAVAATMKQLEGQAASTGQRLADGTAKAAAGATNAKQSFSGLFETFQSGASGPVQQLEQRLTGLADEGLGKAAAAMGMTSGQALALAGGIGVAAGAAIGLGLAFKGSVDEAVGIGGQLHDLSLISGIAVDKLSNLRYAASVLGVDLSTLSNATFMLQRRMAEDTPEFERGLKAIHLTLQDLKGLSPDEMLLKISDAMRETGNQTDIAQAAMGLLGRQGREALPALLEDLRGLTEEAKRLGYTWSVDDVKAAHDYAEAMNRLAFGFEHLKVSLGQSLVPALAEMADLINNEKYGKFFGLLAAGALTGPSGVVSAFSAAYQAQNAPGPTPLAVLHTSGPASSEKDLADQAITKFLTDQMVTLDAEMRRVALTIFGGGKGVTEALQAMQRVGLEPNQIALQKFYDTWKQGQADATKATAEATRDAKKDLADQLKAQQDYTTTVEQLQSHMAETVTKTAAAWAKQEAAAQQSIADARNKTTLDLELDTAKAADTLKQASMSRADWEIAEIERTRTARMAAIDDELNMADDEKRRLKDVWSAYFDWEERQARDSAQVFGQALQQLGQQWQAIGGVTGQIGSSLTIVGKGFDEIEKATTSTGKLEAGLSAAAQVMGQFAQQSRVAATMTGALSGAVAGLEIGTAFGGPGLGTAIGAGVGALAGLFGGGPSAAEQADQQANQQLGQYRDQLTQLYGSMDQVWKVSDLLGANLRNLWNVSGTYGLKAFTQGVADLNAATQALLASVTTGSGVATQALLDLMQMFETEAGQNLQTAKDYYTTQLAQTATALSGILSGLQSHGDQILQQQAITTLQLQGKTLAEATQLASSITDTLSLTDTEVYGLGEAIAATFASMISRGESFDDTLKALQPSIDDLQAMFKTTGQNGGAAFSLISDMAAIAENAVSGPLFSAIENDRLALNGLHNAGILTQGMFTGLTESATDAYNQIVAGGANAQTALMMMQPELQSVFELQSQFGFAVDDATQKLLSQAEAMGIVGTKQTSDTAQASAALQQTADHLGVLVDWFQNLFPSSLEQAFEAALIAAQNAAGTSGSSGGGGNGSAPGSGDGSGGDVEKKASGSRGFEYFGAGRRVELHNWEAVVPLAQAQAGRGDAMDAVLAAAGLTAPASPYMDYGSGALPRATAPTVAQTARAASGGFGGTLQIPIQLMLDRRVFGKAVFEITADELQKARLV
jgi:hypothetical protein